METFKNLFSGNKEELLDALEPFQRDILEPMLNVADPDYAKIADKYLNKIQTDKATFLEVQDSPDSFKENLLKEIEKFLCDRDSYKEDKKKIKSNTDKSITVIISAMSAAIGSYLGAAGTLIAPLIVLIILSSGKITLNAWCETRKQARQKEEEEREKVPA